MRSTLLALAIALLALPGLFAASTPRARRSRTPGPR